MTGVISWAICARVVPAIALLPLGGWVVRLLLAIGATVFLSARLPAGPPLTIGMLLGEIALGASMGLLAGLPVYAAMAIRGTGPAALSFAGRTWAWAIFFAIGGPALWLGAMGDSFTSLPPDAWIEADALARVGGTVFYGALVLGLPTWLVSVALGPIAGMIDRLGGARHGQVLWSTRGWWAVVVLILLLPVLLDVLADVWRAALAG
ncbi:MAG: flagellar biosynthesis protein FliR [Bradymonadia bacterium]|jgi:flagellar biosynthesis protein FliR